MTDLPPRKRLPLWATYAWGVFFLASIIYLIDWQLLIPLMGSQQPDPSTGLIYHVTVTVGRLGAASELVCRILAGNAPSNGEMDCRRSFSFFVSALALLQKHELGTYSRSVLSKPAA
jgi:hypothetical protein